jgi:hypothetical protein
MLCHGQVPKVRQFCAERVMQAIPASLSVARVQSATSPWLNQDSEHALNQITSPHARASLPRNGR